MAIAIGLTAEIALSAYATWRIAKWHAPVKGKARFLDRLVTRDKRVTGAGLLIGAFVVYSLFRFALPQLNLPAPLAPFPSLIIGAVLAVALWGPIDDWRTIRKERHVDE